MLGKSVTLPVVSTTFTAAANDDDGSIVGYLWTQVSGPTCFLSDETTSILTIVGIVAPGTYVFNIIVTDNVGATASTDVALWVSAGRSQVFGMFQGAPDYELPAVIVTLPTTTTNLVIGLNIGNGDSVVSYSWVQYDGDPCTITNELTGEVTLSDLTLGDRAFTCTVNMSSGLVFSESVRVLVVSAGSGAIRYISPSGGIRVPSGSGAIQVSTNQNVVQVRVSGNTRVRIR